MDEYADGRWGDDHWEVGRFVPMVDVPISKQRIWREFESDARAAQLILVVLSISLALVQRACMSSCACACQTAVHVCDSLLCCVDRDGKAARRGRQRRGWRER